MASSTSLSRETAALLSTRRFGRMVRGYESAGSTNQIALQWAAEGALEGSLVTAEHQTAGRGRRGRTWNAPHGQNLLFSLVLRPDLAPEERSILSIVAAVAVGETIDEITAPLQTRVKWPNDVLLEGRKVGGILLEASFSGASGGAIVLGIGLNVNQMNFDAKLTARATSLCLEVGRPLSRATLLARLLGRLESRYDALFAGGRSALLAAYEERLTERGSAITLYRHKSAPPVEGTVLGINSEGALRLRLPEGERVFHAGDVTTRPVQ